MWNLLTLNPCLSSVTMLSEPLTSQPSDLSFLLCGFGVCRLMTDVELALSYSNHQIQMWLNSKASSSFAERLQSQSDVDSWTTDSNDDPDSPARNFLGLAQKNADCVKIKCTAWIWVFPPNNSRPKSARTLQKMSSNLKFNKVSTFSSLVRTWLKHGRDAGVAMVTLSLCARANKAKAEVMTSRPMWLHD